ncbi:hypothetical protein HID58_092693 [Brassica napus]|uniref:Dymeclin n=1 Tax=Brassica napus TaxID=3708 RepID=A0ABQ7XDI7_BRANA|nr:hypothetical protein HID58_092693 [Brassica napus]
MRTRRRNDLKPSIRGQKPRIHGLIISSPTFSALSPDSSSSPHLPSVVKTVSVTDHHASKAEDFFHKFDQMDDTSIFDALTLLLDELTFTKAQTIRFVRSFSRELVQIINFSTSCAYFLQNVPLQTVRYLLEQLFSSTSADTQLKASFIKLLLSLRYINGFIRNATREAGGVDQREVDHSLIVQINMIVFLIHVLAHDPDFPSEDCMDEHVYARFCGPMLSVLLSNKETVLILFSILRAIKRAEDACKTPLSEIRPGGLRGNHRDTIHIMRPSQPRQWENGVPNELIVGTRKRSSVQSGGGSF